MADEIRLRAALSFAKSGRGAGADSGEVSVAMSGTRYLESGQTVGTTEEPLLLGEVPAASAHYFIRNLDATNPVNLKPAGAGGIVTQQIGPGRSTVGQFGSTVAAPYIQAVGAPVEIAVLIVEA